MAGRAIVTASAMTTNVLIHTARVRGENIQELCIET